jgi:hypothetical protein
LAAELSRQEENSGGWLKSATGARLLSEIREEMVASLMCSGDCGRDEGTKEIFMGQGINIPSINFMTRGSNSKHFNPPFVVLLCCLWALSGKQYAQFGS